MKKYKAIAIPVSFVDGKPRFLTVREIGDSRNGYLSQEDVEDEKFTTRFVVLLEN